MLKFISNTPIFRRLFIAFTLAAAIPGIVIVLLGSNYINTLLIRGQAVQTSFDAQSIASQEQTNLQNMNALLQTRHAQIFASLGGSVQDSSLYASGALIYTDILARQADFDQTLRQYQNNFELATSSNMSTIRGILLSDDPESGIISDQQKALNSVINKQWPDYKNLQDQELNQLSTLDSALRKHAVLTPQQINQAYTQAYFTLYQANKSFTELRNSWQRVVSDAVTMGKTVTAVGPSETSPVWISTFMAFIFVALVVVFAGSIVNLTITRPLRQLTSLTRRISKGDTSARARVISRDEIAIVAASMNNMLDNIVRLIQEAQSQRASLQAQVEKLVSEVSGIGEGDLRIQAEVTTDALGVLADSFNYMVEELSSLVVRVKMVAHEVEDSTALTYDRMAQLVENADMQIRQIARAATEVRRMAEASRQVAERARILFNVAREAHQTAQDGREAVQQTVEGMGRIHQNVQETASKVQLLGDRSREINNIVEVISGIATQTNRLALDAAIQAATAGEHGKGFAAVAADIRRLAEGAKAQTSMIARIVRSVSEDIGAVAVSMQDTERETSTGAKLAEEAGTALQSIYAVVERQAREIELINRVSMQQLQSSSAVVQIMQGVSGSTQQSSASTREASQQMERLARLAEQLLTSVEAFKLRENSSFYGPTSNVTITAEEVADSQLTVSGVFRLVSGAAQTQLSHEGMHNGLAPARSAPPYQQKDMRGMPLRPGQRQPESHPRN